MFQQLPRRVNLGFGFKLKPLPRGTSVPMAEAVRRLRDLGQNENVLRSILLAAAQFSLAAGYRERLARAKNIRPVFNREALKAKLRRYMANYKADTAAAQARLSSGKSSAKERRRQESRIQANERAIARLQGRIAGGGSHTQRPESEGFKTRWGEVEKLLTMADANASVPSLRSTKFTLDLISEDALDTILIRSTKQKTPGDMSGQDTVMLNTLWRLIEFGSGKFAKPGPRLRGLSKVKDEDLDKLGMTAAGMEGAWWLGPRGEGLIVLGQRAGNVLRQQNQALYNSDRVLLFSEIKRMIHVFLRDGLKGLAAIQ